MNRALGLIEVIGYVPAIEAADSALKAANIVLVGIDKVDGGIVTVKVSGDVGAVNAAVEAAGIAASRIGTLRATHVIPRVQEDVWHMVMISSYKKKPDIISIKVEEEIKEEIKEEVKEEIKEEVKEEIKEDQDVLGTMSLKELKGLINKLDIQITTSKLKNAKKSQLVDMILKFYKEGVNGGTNR